MRGDPQVARIAVVTTTRADYHILQPLLLEIVNSGVLELQLVVSGTHLSEQHGRTVSSILDDGFAIAAFLDIRLENSSPMPLTRACGSLTEQFGAFLESHSPDLVIILGDRFELLSIAQAATIFGVPIGHIHGGEITQGALDDAVRHALTKLSHVHFTASAPFARRIIAMGEEAKRVHTVGSLGVDAVLAAQHRHVSENLDIRAKVGSPYVVVTLHPETRGTKSPETLTWSLIEALDEMDEVGIVITSSNSDPGADEITRHLRQWAERRPRTIWIPSLGNSFARVLKDSAAIIGNSSSGIIEAPALGVPTVNIGVRQAGRPCARSISTVDAVPELIRTAVLDALSNPRTSDFESLPYGRGGAAKSIVDIIRELEVRALLEKRSS